MSMQSFRPLNNDRAFCCSRRQLLALLTAGFCAMATSPLVNAGIQVRGSISSVSPPIIAALQRRLLELGFDTGPDDGKWGPRTARAYAEFSEREGIAVVDRLTRAHVKALWGVDIDPATDDGQEIMNFMEAIGVQF